MTSPKETKTSTPLPVDTPPPLQQLRSAIQLAVAKRVAERETHTPLAQLPSTAPQISNPTDIALINHLYETLALKDAIILNLQEGLQLSRKCEQQLQLRVNECEQQLQLRVNEQLNSSKETQLKLNILIRKNRELEEINEKKR